MPAYNNDIEQILEKGFTRLPVADAVAEKAIDAVIRRGAAGERDSFLLPFRRSGTEWIYALAATLILGVGTGYLLLHKSPAPAGTVVTKESGQALQPQRIVSVVSAVNDSADVSGRSRCSDDEFTTGRRSQLLLSVGMRTRTILFERAHMKIDRADSLRTVVALRRGAVAVDVVPGGASDTVTIVTTCASFTQIGTRFSVVVDSMENAGVEVYRGKVRVQDSTGTDIMVGAGQSWVNGKGGDVGTVRRSLSELRGMQRIFADNTIDRFLEWSTGLPQHPAAAARQPQRRKSVDTAAGVPETILSDIEKMSAHNDYRALDSVIAHLHDTSLADAIFRKLYSTAERKISLFRFLDAKRLLELLENGDTFSMRRREDASMRCYILHKEHIKTSSGELLEMIQGHRMRFPDGAYGDDMAAEAISLLLVTRDYKTAVDEMEYLLERYPRSPHGEYYSYVYASTLRENLRQYDKALAAYKKYAAEFPDGKYEEDALYWIIKLSRSSREGNNAAVYKKRYLKRYPRGRWISDVR